MEKQTTLLILAIVLLVVFLFAFSYYDSLNNLNTEKIDKPTEVLTPQDPAIKINVVDENAPYPPTAIRVVVIDN